VSVERPAVPFQVLGTAAQELAEIWTFRCDDRDRTPGWQLLAIEQIESKPNVK